MGLTWSQISHIIILLSSEWAEAKDSSKSSHIGTLGEPFRHPLPRGPHRLGRKEVTPNRKRTPTRVGEVTQPSFLPSTPRSWG